MTSTAVSAAGPVDTPARTDEDVADVGERVHSICCHRPQPADEDSSSDGRQRDVPEALGAVRRVAPLGLPIEHRVQRCDGDQHGTQQRELHQPALLAMISSIWSANVRSSMTPVWTSTSSPPAAKKNVSGTPRLPPSSVGMKPSRSKRCWMGASGEELCNESPGAALRVPDVDADELHPALRMPPWRDRAAALRSDTGWHHDAQTLSTTG